MAGRPIILSILALLLGLIGLLGIASGVYGLIDNMATEGIIAVVIGAIYFIIALGIWRGYKIFWYIGVIYAVFNIIIDLYNTIAEGSFNYVLAIILNLIVLWYLLTSKVKKHFGI